MSKCEWALKKNPFLKEEEIAADTNFILYIRTYSREDYALSTKTKKATLYQHVEQACLPLQEGCFKVTLLAASFFSASIRGCWRAHQGTVSAVITEMKIRGHRYAVTGERKRGGKRGGEGRGRTHFDPFGITRDSLPQFLNAVKLFLHQMSNNISNKLPTPSKHHTCSPDTYVVYPCRTSSSQHCFLRWDILSSR